MSEGDTPQLEPNEDARVEHGVSVRAAIDMDEYFPTTQQYLGLVKALRSDGFWMCLDVCGVDYLDSSARDLPSGVAAQRFEVVTHLINHGTRARVRIRVQVPDESMSVPSLVRVHPGADAPEREAYDLFGIRFDGHPDLSRILLPPEWKGHPLRKDYSTGRIPVQFRSDPLGLEGQR
jgi:NADH-quinone oxidoreductase subunit C